MRRSGQTVFAVLCALVLTLAQTLTLAHASSHEASAPGHDSKTCIYHVNGDRPACALTPETPSLTAPVFVEAAGFDGEVASAPMRRPATLRARGPPLQD